mmetsp:Transcript_14882/g.44754  ORF Transcript_14882/g.44754 Transcript_14882/m.44754 type:complete len:921 (-) Transcript_14882:2637-5399(-)
MGAARLRRDVVAQPRAVARVRLRALLGGEHAALRADRRRQDKRRDAHAAARDRAAPPARRLVRPRRLQDRVRGADEGARAGDGAQLWEAARALRHHRQRAHRGPAAHQGADRADAAHRHDAREVGRHHPQGLGRDRPVGRLARHRRGALAQRGPRPRHRGAGRAHAAARRVVAADDPHRRPVGHAPKLRRRGPLPARQPADRPLPLWRRVPPRPAQANLPRRDEAAREAARGRQAQGGAACQGGVAADADARARIRQGARRPAARQAGDGLRARAQRDAAHRARAARARKGAAGRGAVCAKAGPPSLRARAARGCALPQRRAAHALQRRARGAPRGDAAARAVDDGAALRRRDDQRALLDGDARVGRQPARPHRHHQGDAGVLAREGVVDRALDDGRDADARPRGPAAVRQPRRREGRRHHPHDAQRAAVLPLAAQPAAADRVAVRGQAGRQPQRRDRPRHGAERARGRQLARLHLPVRAHAAQPLPLRRLGRGEGVRPAARAAAHRHGPLRRDAARQDGAHQVRAKVGPVPAHRPRAGRRVLLRRRVDHLGVQRAPQAHPLRHRAPPPLLALQGLLQPDGARGGEAGADAARRARPDPRQGGGRRALGQDERAAAGLHLAAQARRLLAPLRHDLHHPVGGAAHALHPRDRAQARLGGARRARAQLLQDDRPAHVALADAAAPVQEHPRGHHQEDRAQGLPLGALLRPRAAGDWRAHPLPEDGQGHLPLRPPVPAARALGARAADHAHRAARRAHNHARLPVRAQGARHRRALLRARRGRRPGARPPLGALPPQGQVRRGRPLAHLHHPDLRPAAAAVLCSRRLGPLARVRGDAADLVPPPHPAGEVPAAHGAPRPAAAARLRARRLRLALRGRLLALQPHPDANLLHPLRRRRECAHRRAHRLGQDHLRRVRLPAAAAD